jgi:hypothetical protein
MFLIVQNTRVLVICLAVSLCYALARIAVLSLLCRPSAALLALLTTQLKTKKELGSIKSVQTDFVRHSRLNRQMIQLDKEVAAKKGE